MGQHGHQESRLQRREIRRIAHRTDTVNTVPVETLDAYRDHGDPQARLEQDVEHAAWVLEQLPQLGMDIDTLTQQLEDEGVEKFNKPFDKLMDTLGADDWRDLCLRPDALPHAQTWRER